MFKIKNLSVSFFIAVLFAGGALSIFTVQSSVFSKLSFFALSAQAKDGEDEKDNEGEDENENEDDEEDNREKEEKKRLKEKEKNDKEIAKKRANYQRDQLKMKAEALRRQKKVQGGQNESEDKVAKEREKSDEKKADSLEDILEEIIKAEERIARAQAEGIDVTKALATLALAKEKAKSAEANLSTLTEEELRRIEREVKKLAHFASYKDVKSAKDVQKDISKISKRITQTEGKISLFVSLGGDAMMFTADLNSLKSEFALLKENLAKGGQDQTSAISQLEPLERKVKRLKSFIEQAIYALGGTDEEYDDDYKNESEDIYEDLNDVAEIEGDEIGMTIKAIALEQKNSSENVSRSVSALDDRNRVLQFLFGTKMSEVEKLETEVAANKARINALNQAVQSIEDPEVKQILLDQISVLQQETNKLEVFADGQRDRLSAFGWFFKLF